MNARCPGCNQPISLDRGFVPMHMTDLQRGQLVTGSKVCEFSNKKIVFDKLQATYSNNCEDCGMETTMTLTESYPGAFADGIKAFVEMDCIGCSIPEDGHYCSDAECGLPLVEHTTEFYRVSDSLGAHLPLLKGETRKVEYRDFDTEAEATAYIATLPVEDEDEDRFEIDRLPTGWYDTIGSTQCTVGNPHTPVWREKYTKTVLVTDGHIIHETSDDEDEPTFGPDDQITVDGQDAGTVAGVLADTRTAPTTQDTNDMLKRLLNQFKSGGNHA